MIDILNKRNLEYSVNDTFNLPVLSLPGSEFSEGMQLKFIISKSEYSDPVIEKTFNINSDLTFTVVLTDSEKKLLQIGEYIYKMITYRNNEIDTQISGYFNVIWGASATKKQTLFLGNALQFTVTYRDKINETEKAIAELPEIYTPLTLFNSLQAQVAQMIKPQYLTNISYLFSENSNADLMSVLDTSYAITADYTYSKNTAENISFKADNCISMQHCFEKSAVKSVEFPNGTPKLTKANHLFNKCTDLESVTGLDCTNVETLKYAFANCTNLTTVDLVSVQNVTDLSYAFYNSGLTGELGLGNVKATNLDGAFAKTPVETVRLYDCSQTTSASGIFTDCNNLSVVELYYVGDIILTETAESLPVTESGTISLHNCNLSSEAWNTAFNTLREKGWNVNAD